MRSAVVVKMDGRYVDQALAVLQAMFAP